MARFNQQARKDVNKVLYVVSRTRHEGIPIDLIDEALRATGYKLVQEDGTDWEGIFCGREGSCTIRFATMAGELVENSLLALQWYLQTTKYEVNAYMS